MLKNSPNEETMFFTLDNIQENITNIIESKLDKFTKEKHIDSNISAEQKQGLFSFLDYPPNSMITKVCNKFGYDYIVNNVSIVNLVIVYNAFSSPDSVFKSVLDSLTVSNFVCATLNCFSPKNTEIRDFLLKFIVDLGFNMNRVGVDSDLMSEFVFDESLFLKYDTYNRDILMNILNIDYIEHEIYNRDEAMGKKKTLKQLKELGL